MTRPPWTEPGISFHGPAISNFNLQTRDHNAEGIVFRKRYNRQELFSGGLKTPKSNLKTYSRNLEKNIFRPKIYDFVIKFS